MKALVIGSTGMDGSHLVDALLDQGHEVFATYRRTSVDNLHRIRHKLDHITLLPLDLMDYGSIAQTLDNVEPDWIFNEADQDNIDWSYRVPELSVDLTYGGVVRLTEAIMKHCPDAMLFQPCSITIYGDVEPPQWEETPISPFPPSDRDWETTPP